MLRRNYLYHILSDGARPFLYRNKVRSLLGIPDNQDSTFSFPPNLPPPGFRYINHPLIGEFNLSYPYGSHVSHINGSLPHHDHHVQGADHDNLQTEDHYEDNAKRRNKPEQRLSKSNESDREKNSENLNNSEEKNVHNSKSKPKALKSFTFKPDDNDSTELTIPEITEIERSNARHRKPFPYKSVRDSEMDLSDMIEPSEPLQMPSVKSKKKTLPDYEQQQPGISSEFDIDIPGVSNERQVFPLLSSSDVKKESRKGTGKTDQQTDNNERADFHNEKLSKPVKTHYKSLKGHMSETPERDYRETSDKKSPYPQNRLQGTGPEYRGSQHFPHLQEDVELQRKNKVYKKVTKMTDHIVEEQSVERKASKKKHISQNNETQEVVIIRKESSPLASSYAFWERSYLSSFLLKYMR